MIFWVDYASPSLFDAQPDAYSLELAANARRPVRFHGEIKQHSFLFRVAMRALGELIWSNDTWTPSIDILDPVVTVHPDRLFLEGFSRDQSAYGCLILDPEIFDIQGEVATGTTNVDFTAWLWGALDEIRSSRKTMFRVGSEGVQVTTSTAGGRFEKKVDLPDDWVRGFLQVQEAMAMPGTWFTVEPVDLLSATRYLRYTKARMSPRALRFEFEPGQDVRLVLEPWEHVVPFHGAEHHYNEPKTTRVWGRRRLKLIEGLLPFAESVDVYLKGRGLPSFYAVKLPGMTFVLGLTGGSGAGAGAGMRSRSGFATTGGFDMLSATTEDDEQLNAALDFLRRDYHASATQLAEHLGVDLPRATGLLVRLTRQGRVMFDAETRDYRFRELFESPADEHVFFPPDLRRQRAAEYVDRGDVMVLSCTMEENVKVKRLKSPDGPMTREIIYRDWRVKGQVGEINGVELVVSNSGRIIFGRCECDFFQDHLMNEGPCEHILALFQQSTEFRSEGASSRPTDGTRTPRREPSRWEVEGGEVDLGEEEGENMG